MHPNISWVKGCNKNILCLQILLNAYAFCKILQILNETDTAADEATVVVHARPFRVEVEAVRVVAIELSSRPIVAEVLHAVHTSTVAVASSREEDST